MTVRILVGDCRDTLKTLPDESVQCVITSPPYYGLRDYGEGDQIGLEQTPEEYIEQMVAVFREVRRVLRGDGVCWLNLGDSYASSGGVTQPHRDTSGGFGGRDKLTRGAQGYAASGGGFTRPETVGNGLKPKDLIGIPWRVALALQADGVADYKAMQVVERVRGRILDAYDGGIIPDRVLYTLDNLRQEYEQAKGESWWLRQDIIWQKPNPMPESVTDRCTKAHEYVFLLSKSARYYYDHDAVREEIKPSSGVNIRARARTASGAMGGDNQHNMESRTYDKIKGANRRSVWTISTRPYSGAHFATFPPGLVEPMVLAGSAEGDVVLDPFGGAGTVGLVADRLGRDAILIELNADYAEMARQRIVGDAPMFASVTLDLHGAGR